MKQTKIEQNCPHRKVLFLGLLCVLLIASATLFIAPFAWADDETSTTDAQVELYKTNPTDNERFDMSNILPGDTMYKEFHVKVSFNKTADVYFGVDVTKGGDDLAKAMMCRIVLVGTGETLYEGPISELGTTSVTYHLSASSTEVEELNYGVTVWLPTTAGNEYAEKVLSVDFTWTAEGNLEPLPDTGDTLTIILIILGVAALAVLIIFIARKKKQEASIERIAEDTEPSNPIIDAKKRRIKKEMRWTIVTIALLAACAGGVALAYSHTTISENVFETGVIALNVNGEQPVIGNDEAIAFEPGATIAKRFYIQNDSSADAWIKFYLADTTGELGDILEMSVYEGTTCVYSGKATDFTEANAYEITSEFAQGERRYYSISFHFPEDAGNEYQGAVFKFKLTANATQTKNNPNRES